MIKNIRQLTGIELCNIFRLNEARYSKDKGKRRRFAGMALVWGILLVMYIAYLSVFSSALLHLGMGDVIPVYFYAVVSLIILFFSFFKTAGVLFKSQAFDMLISLPVSKTAIILSRFLTMYVMNLLLGVVTMLPGIVIYGIGMHPSISFYLYTLAGTVLLPLLPMTISAAIGTLITAVGARMKHKSIAISLLTIIFIVVVLSISMIIPEDVPAFSEEMIKNLSDMLIQQISGIYPPAVWFGNAAVNGSFVSFLMLTAGAAVAFTVFMAVLQRYFMSIYQALHATYAKHNYKLQHLHTGSLLKALWYRELKRYFASSIYVSNTIVGYLLMAIAAIAVCVMGIDKMEDLISMPGMVSRALPLFVGFMAGLMPTTSCSISMEGKQLWIAQSLPVNMKAVQDSKILVNLTVACPFYIVAVIFGSIAVGGRGFLWMIIIPAVYILFTAVAGITVNLAVPVFNWESEVQVVKQSMSTMLTMLVGFISFLIPAGCMLVFSQIPAASIFAVTAMILMLLTGLLYNRNNRKWLSDLG